MSFGGVKTTGEDVSTYTEERQSRNGYGKNEKFKRKESDNNIGAEDTAIKQNENASKKTRGKMQEVKLKHVRPIKQTFII